MPRAKLGLQGFCKCGNSIKIFKSIPNSGLCRSCAHHKVPDYTFTYTKLCKAAREKGIPNVLTFSEFLTFTRIKNCAYCGDEITWLKKRGTRYNLDRKDNSKGYTLKNCIACCKECNYKKGDKLSYREMIRISNKKETSSDKFEREREEFLVANDLWE